MREQVIDSAKDIFSRFGFKKTTVDDIAHSIHKAKSSIYYYFGSKEKIFEEVIPREYAYLKDRLSEAFEAEDTPEGKLRAYVLTRLRVLLKVSNFYGAITSDYFSYFGLIEKLRKEYVQEEWNWSGSRLPPRPVCWQVRSYVSCNRADFTRLLG